MTTAGANAWEDNLIADLRANGGSQARARWRGRTCSCSTRPARRAGSSDGRSSATPATVTTSSSPAPPTAGRRIPPGSGTSRRAPGHVRRRHDGEGGHRDDHRRRRAGTALGRDRGGPAPLWRLSSEGRRAHHSSGAAHTRRMTGPSVPPIQEGVTMGDNMEIAAAYENALRSGDFGEISRLTREWSTDDFVQEWPQSGERLRKADAIRVDEGYAEMSGTSADVHATSGCSAVATASSSRARSTMATVSPSATSGSARCVTARSRR